MTFLRSTIIIGLVVLMIASCDKNQLPTTQTNPIVEFRLTDGPCDYDHLYIDVKGIEIHSDSTGWQDLQPFNAGIYDILELTNGLDTLLCRTTLPVGTISQIRLILGDNNTLETDGSTYDLAVPSGSTSGLKINLHQQLLANTSYSIWLDFDACKSIVRRGNGTFGLKPVIRAFSDSTNGKLTGYVLPDSLNSEVHVIDNGDTITALPEANGYFMVCGLDGVYDVHIASNDSTVQDSLIPNVSVDFGEIVSLDTINLN